MKFYFKQLQKRQWNQGSLSSDLEIKKTVWNLTILCELVLCEKISASSFINALFFFFEVVFSKRILQRDHFFFGAAFRFHFTNKRALHHYSWTRLFFIWGEESIFFFTYSFFWFSALTWGLVPDLSPRYSGSVKRTSDYSLHYYTFRGSHRIQAL